MMKFEVGDIVRLKSGGPEMTVTRTDNTMSDDIGAMWFDKSSLMKGWFPMDAIEVVQQ